MRKIVLLFLALLSGGVAMAQNASPTPSPSPANANRFWRANLPGGTYLIELGRIQSISIHEYTIAPVTRVTEMTVESSGPVLARFYCLETETPQTPMGIGQSAVDLLKDRTEQAAEAVSGSTSEDVWKKVVKVYPTTTHAHTVEYRVSSKGALRQLFNHADQCWTTGRGSAISVR